MALLDRELDRIKYELGYNVLSAGAEPYINVTAIFGTVIQDNMNSGAITTSSTAVSAASTATPATLTLASATGFANGQRVVIDVDARQEIATVQSISGSDIVVLLTGVHSGTYNVTVEGGESIVREILLTLDGIVKTFGGADVIASAGLRKVDEIEFFGASGNNSRLDALKELQRFWRNQLASALGVENLWETRKMSGGSASLY